jgi:hypothetical protein
MYETRVSPAATIRVIPVTCEVLRAALQETPKMGKEINP